MDQRRARVLVGTGLLTWFAFLLILLRQQDIPASAPIVLVRGDTTATDFTPRFDGAYRLWLTVPSRPGPLPGDALGMLSRPRQPGDSLRFSEIDIAWELRRAGRVAASGHATGWDEGYMGGGRLALPYRLLGFFRCRAGTRYRLRTFVRQRALTLLRCQTWLEIKRDPSGYSRLETFVEGGLAIAVLLFVAGIIVGMRSG
jgi:hypothetical protein